MFSSTFLQEIKQEQPEEDPLAIDNDVLHPPDIKIETEENEEEITIMVDENCWFDCEYCSYKSLSARDLSRHVLREHTSHRCNHCSFKSKKKSNLDSHILYKHTDPKDINWLACPKCPYKAKCKNLLCNHFKNKHLKRGRRQASDCEKDYPQEKSNRNIENEYDMEKEPGYRRRFTCKHCLYQTFFRGNIRRHIIRNHTDYDDRKWIQCPQCPYQAKTNYLLAKHLMQHSDEVKPQLEEKTQESCEENSPKSKNTDPKDLIWISCPKCKYKATNHDLWSEHVKNHDRQTNKSAKRDKIQEVIKINDGTFFVPENSTKKEILPIRDIKIEYELETDKTSFICKHCRHQSSNIFYMTRHIIFKHSKFKLMNWTLCPLCPSIIKNRQLLLKHWKRHEKQYKNAEGEVEATDFVKVESQHEKGEKEAESMQFDLKEHSYFKSPQL